MSVSIITVPTAKGSYQKADVAYKNLSFQGKVEGKIVMSFGATAKGFKALAEAQPGETYEVEVVKNAAGYNDWVSLSKAGAGSTNSNSTSVPSVSPIGAMRGTGAASAPARSTYETPEERAKKQVYIVRQSSISNAIAILSLGAKAPLKSGDVIALAKELEAAVFSEGDGVAIRGGATGFDDVPDFPVDFDKQPQVV